MNILITGAAGYIGSKLCARILYKHPSAKIYAFDNLMHNQWDLVSKVFESKNIKFYDEDILDFGSNLRRAIKKADFIFPLAAIVGAPACDALPHLARETNAYWIDSLVTHHLEKKQPVIVYPNTNSGYGTTEVNTVCTEATPLNPISFYGQTKALAEKSLLENQGFPIVFRLATAFGTSPRPRLDLLVNNLIYTALNTRKLQIFDGHFRRNYIHVSDICDAFLFTLTRWREMAGNVYNLGNDRLNCTKLELAKIIQDGLESPDFTVEVTEQTDGKTDPDKRDYIVSSKKLYQLGFKPSTNNFTIWEMSQFCRAVGSNINPSMWNY